MRPLQAVLLPLLAAGVVLSAPPAAVPEAEPNGFTTPAPQAIGVLGAAGLDVAGTLDPTSPSGLDPGDRDGFSFTVAEDGPLTATVEDGAGATLVLALARETGGSPSGLGAVIGRAPLVLSVPVLKAGTTYRLGVAALGDGTPLPYTLSLRTSASLPGWSGEICEEEIAGAEPDGSASEAADMGFFTGVLCARGVLETIVPPGGEGEGDIDHFRFRNVLPVAARVRFRSDPGLLRVEGRVLSFVGTQVLATASSGEEGVLELPVLHPGSDCFVTVSADQGIAPLAYAFSLEPVAGEPPPEPEPLELTRARLRLAAGGGRTAFRVDATFQPGVGGGLAEGVPFAWSLRGTGEELAGGLLTADARGRLRYRAPRGSRGLRSFVFDPYGGRLTLRGRDVDWSPTEESDAEVEVRVSLDDLVLAATGEGEFRAGGRVLLVR